MNPNTVAGSIAHQSQFSESNLLPKQSCSLSVFKHKVLSSNHMYHSSYCIHSCQISYLWFKILGTLKASIHEAPHSSALESDLSVCVSAQGITQSLVKVTFSKARMLWIVKIFSFQKRWLKKQIRTPVCTKVFIEQKAA